MEPKLDIWKPLSAEELRDALSALEAPFWISGGVAIDMYLGKPTRLHDDLDISVDRKNQSCFQKALAGWNLQVADPPGSGKLRNWIDNEFLQSPIYNIWCRPASTDFWAFEIMLCEFEDEKWVYRRNKNIQGEQKDFGWTTSDGFNVISPEIQLLYKSRNVREKDELDFQNCLPILSDKRRARLKSSIEIDSSPVHPWVRSL